MASSHYLEYFHSIMYQSHFQNVMEEAFRAANATAQLSETNVEKEDGLGSFRLSHCLFFRRKSETADNVSMACERVQFT